MTKRLSSVPVSPQSSQAYKSTLLSTAHDNVLVESELQKWDIIWWLALVEEIDYNGVHEGVLASRFVRHEEDHDKCRQYDCAENRQSDWSPDILSNLHLQAKHSPSVFFCTESRMRKMWSLKKIVHMDPNTLGSREWLLHKSEQDLHRPRHIRSRPARPNAI